MPLLDLVIIKTQDVTFDKSKDASRKFSMIGVDYEDGADGDDDEENCGDD